MKIYRYDRFVKGRLAEGALRSRLLSVAFVARFS
jgi:hypothetical protein